MQKQPDFTLIDLFSGIGGFSFAFESAGFRTVAFAELDPDKSIVLDYHWPDVPNLRDVRGVGAATVERPCVITGGVPCQPASLLGQRRGTSDERWLWPETIRIMRELRPRFAVFENPPALLTLEDGRAWNGITSGLVSLGYDLWWDVFPAAAFGAGHLRERIMLVCADAAGQQDRRGSQLAASSASSNPNQQRRDEAGRRVLERTPGRDDVWRQPVADNSEATATDANGARLQGHAGNGENGGRRQGSRRPIAPPDLRERVSCPDWWYEAVTGIPVLVDGLPSRLVEAISRCAGDSVVPQAVAPIAKAIARQIALHPTHQLASERIG